MPQHLSEHVMSCPAARCRILPCTARLLAVSTMLYSALLVKQKRMHRLLRIATKPVLKPVQTAPLQARAYRQSAPQRGNAAKHDNVLQQSAATGQRAATTAEVYIGRSAHWDQLIHCARHSTAAVPPPTHTRRAQMRSTRRSLCVAAGRRHAKTCVTRCARYGGAGARRTSAAAAAPRRPRSAASGSGRSGRRARSRRAARPGARCGRTGRSAPARFRVRHGACCGGRARRGRLLRARTMPR